MPGISAMKVAQELESKTKATLRPREALATRDVASLSFADVWKEYGEVQALRGLDLEVPGRRADHHRGPVRLREEHRAAVGRGPGGSHRGVDLDRRARRDEGAGRQAQRLDGLPELRALPAPHGQGEHRLRPAPPAGCRKQTQERRVQGAPSSSAAAISSSGSPYQLSGGERQRVALARALVRRAGRLSSSTSRSPTSTRSCACACGRS